MAPPVKPVRHYDAQYGRSDGGVINVALGSVLGVVPPLWFEPGYTSVSRMIASRTGIRSVASLNELAHLEAKRERT